jgi:hypothetical protein
MHKSRMRIVRFLRNLSNMYQPAVLKNKKGQGLAPAARGLTPPHIICVSSCISYKVLEVQHTKNAGSVSNLFNGTGPQ